MACTRDQSIWFNINELGMVCTGNLNILSSGCCTLGQRQQQGHLHLLTTKRHRGFEGQEENENLDASNIHIFVVYWGKRPQRGSAARPPSACE
jgi:hypothetical protein